MMRLGRKPKSLSTNDNTLSETSGKNVKSPARIAVLPSHGSDLQTPSKDQKMNSTDSTTGPAAAPVPKDILDLFEGSINNATRMASILAFLLEQGLKSDMEDVTGARGKNMFHLVSEEREDIMFTIYRLQDAIGEIESAFEEAIR